MAEITAGGKPVHTSGELPAIGSPAPDFLLTKNDLSDVSLKDFAGQRIVLNIFLSVDTGTCATSVRRFNAEIDKVANAVCLCVSRDLPFAQARFCGAEGLDRVISVSELRNLDFGERYGVRISDGPLAGLLARSVVVIDEKGKVIYRQLVPEIQDEPDYEAALAILR
jgi:thioredoxin-dependent peroxiredoxin